MEDAGTQTAVEFLLIDLDLASTFLDIADTSQDPETVWRNRLNATHVADVVAEFLRKLTLTPDARQRVEAKLSSLNARLQSAV